MQATIEGKANAAKMARWAMKQTKSCGAKGLIARQIKRQIKKKAGLEHVTLTMSGSAALAKETAVFYEGLEMFMREGYGATETAGCIFGNTREAFKIGSLGRPGPGIEVKIIPRPEIDTDGCTGLLWVRGRMVFKGYWRDEQKTKESFDAEGFYCMGDVVRVDEDDFYWFIDRDGSGFKLDTGEFCSSTTLNTALEGQELIAHAAVAGPNRPCILGLIFPDRALAKRIAGNAPEGVDERDYYENHEGLKQAVADAVKAANAALEQNPNAKKWERVRLARICWGEVTVDNGLLTPTQKLKTKKALEACKDVIESEYARAAKK
jgi:long-chain acyl-CoA synthetase